MTEAPRIIDEGFTLGLALEGISAADVAPSEEGMSPTPKVGSAMRVADKPPSNGNGDKGHVPSWLSS